MCSNMLEIRVPVYMVAVAITLAGCGTEVAVDQTPITALESVAPEEVLVQFRNYAEAEAVNVEFYATNEPLETVPEQLFHEANRVTNSIGVAGTGIVQPLRVDAITFPCTENLTLGTTGGTFSDNETGEVRGAGTRRWVQEGPLALCGHVVTFEFRPDGERFVTIAKIGE